MRRHNFTIRIPAPEGSRIPDTVATVKLSAHRCACSRCENFILTLQGEFQNTADEGVEIEQHMILPVAALGFLAEAVGEIMRDERFVQ
jgi:hypothetical protein